MPGNRLHLDFKDIVLFGFFVCIEHRSYIY